MEAHLVKSGTIVLKFWMHIDKDEQEKPAHARHGRERGAQRFVITGGGEPGLLPHAQMLALIRTGRAHFDKGVLISNGVHLARLDEADRRARLWHGGSRRRHPGHGRFDL